MNSTSSTAKQPIHLVIVEDIPLVVDGIKMAIQHHDHIQLIGSANNSRKALSLIAEKRAVIDVAIVDLNLKEKHAAKADELCEQLCQRFPNIPILVFTIYEGLSLVKRLKAMGVKGYLSKNYDADELISAIEALASGDTYFPQLNSLPILDTDQHPGIDTQASEAQEDAYEKINRLTARELDVARLMVSGKNKDEIATALVLSPNTVNIHRNRIFQKMGVGSAHQLTAIYKGTL